MDTLHLLHVLGKSVRDIGHGVMLVKEDDIDPKTMVCFSDKRSAFHFGFGYKCGESLRVIYGEEDEKKVRTEPAGSFVIGLITVFDAILTGRQSGQKLQCLYGNPLVKDCIQV